MRKACAIISFLLLIAPRTDAATYRVGPGEKYETVSQVASRLTAGDVVEIMGDVADSFTLTAGGTADRPITIRGLTRIVDGQIVRANLRPPSIPCANIVTCRGDWTVIEGLDISGETDGAFGSGAIILAASNLTIRNCRIHHNWRAIHTIEDKTGDVLVEFCEFDANGYAERPPVAFYSVRPGTQVTVQHSYFHDGTGGNFLRLCVPRAVVRYNWFENPYEHAVQISTPDFASTPERIALGDSLLPFHGDIVGNVVVFGWGPGSAYCAVSLGGDSAEAPGTEGDFNLAHNLILTRRGGATPQVAVLVHGNVDHVNLFNNVILEGGVRGCMVFSREMVFEGRRREAFKERRGSGDPTVAGANNWISAAASACPPGLNGTILGVNPRFMNLVGYDFRPQPDSPLAAAALCLLPESKVSHLVPEYEPERGIPADLKPRARREVPVPSVGPFEMSEVPVAFEDDSSDLVLNVRHSGGRFAWPFDFGGWRRQAMEHLYAGEPANALAYAKMQFLVSPMDTSAIDAAIACVKQVLRIIDGNEIRASALERYARLGVGGDDGAKGTPDDLADPLANVSLQCLRKSLNFYTQCDMAVDANASVGAGTKWPMSSYEQNWYKTEKAFARIEGAQCEDAFLPLITVLAESAKQPAGDIDGEKVLQRNQAVLDRIASGLSVIARSRSGSLAGVDRFVKTNLDYAKYGPSGKDGQLGTADDISLDDCGIDSGGRRGEGTSVADVARAIPQRGDGQRMLSLNRHLEALEDARARAVNKLDLIISETASGKASGFAFTSPTSNEFLEYVRRRISGAPLDLAGLGSPENSGAQEALDNAFKAADSTVVERFRVMLALNPSRDTVSHARQYLAAYVVGTHGGSTYPALFALLASLPATENAEDTAAMPAVIAYDAAGPLNDPFAAADLVDALDEANIEAWPSGGRQALLEAIERAQYARIRSIDQVAQNSSPGDAVVLYHTSLVFCKKYLARFPESNNAVSVEFQKGFYEYRARDYVAAVSDVESFVRRHPESQHVSAAKLVAGLATMESGDTGAGLKKLQEIPLKYPGTAAAARALVAMGNLHFRTQQYELAKECFQQIADFYPSDSYAAQARAMLQKMQDAKGDSRAQ